jgi:hypothetical protein
VGRNAPAVNELGRTAQQREIEERGRLEVWSRSDAVVSFGLRCAVMRLQDGTTAVAYALANDGKVRGAAPLRPGPLPSEEPVFFETLVAELPVHSLDTQ